jgi:hypothetical protein
MPTRPTLQGRRKKPCLFSAIAESTPIGWSRAQSPAPSSGASALQVQDPAGQEQSEVGSRQVVLGFAAASTDAAD